ncbi:hypothetical protein V8F20_007881 [Naviculisporaceae sp. PSN 640]
MLTKKGALALFATSLFTSNVFANAVLPRDGDDPTLDVIQTDKLEGGTMVWYGNATQNALIGQRVQAGLPLTDLDFLADSPEVHPEAQQLQKRQCGSSGINCKFDLRAPNNICQSLLTLINARSTSTLPYFPHSVCWVDDIGTGDRCCVAWTNPVLAYYSNIQFPTFVTYNHCHGTSPALVAGVNVGVILGGLCQNVCLANTNTAYWCSTG